MRERNQRIDKQTFSRLKMRTLNAVTGPAALVLFPAISLATFWLGGERALFAMAVLVPFAYFLSGGISPFPVIIERYNPAKNGLLTRPAMELRCEKIFAEATRQGFRSCIQIIEIEGFAELSHRYGHLVGDLVILKMSERLKGVMNDGDVIGQIGDTRFAVCVKPVHQLSLELCIQLAARLQAAAQEPISVEGTVVYANVCIGFCQNSRSPASSGTEWLQAACVALRRAQSHGPSSIRAFSEQMHQETKTLRALHEDVVAAFDSGEIAPWFQPQISTDTGFITGFEALARWIHPVRGVVAPAEFLPAVEAAGMIERLAEVMMYHSFRALKQWDAAGVDVPQIGVNFTGAELSNPRLLEKIEWDLDRFELTPDRLAIEVLETVVSSAPNDIITRNIKALGELGCRIDLDDFGTGNASISSIRRFSVNRIKIDSSFVTKADCDPEQQRMIGAILTMAERLDVETLAEGVETVGEHVLLAQLGCSHVQGFGIARPMPFDQTLDWITAHNAKLQDVPQIMQGRRK